MNYNIIAYIIYIAITFFIIVNVGMVFYKNGRVFILNLFHGDDDTTDRINKLLLVGYYLLNLGYTLLSITTWTKVGDTSELVSQLSYRLGILIMLLGIMHYFNMAVLHFLSHSKSKLFHH